MIAKRREKKRVTLDFSLILIMANLEHTEEIDDYNLYDYKAC
jgi:hypothetical protein